MLTRTFVVWFFQIHLMTDLTRTVAHDTLWLTTFTFEGGAIMTIFTHNMPEQTIEVSSFVECAF